MNYRAKYKKVGNMKYISHLDLVRLFHRVLRKSELDIEFSKGFNPHPIIAFANASGVGIESIGEYTDFELKNDIEESTVLEDINKAMPEGIELLEILRMPIKVDSLMSVVNKSEYKILIDLEELDIDISNFNNCINKFLEQEEILIKKKTKNKRKRRKTPFKLVNIREMILDVLIVNINENEIELLVTLSSGSSENLKPSIFIEKLFEFIGVNINKSEFNILRNDFFTEYNGESINLMEYSKKILEVKSNG